MATSFGQHIWYRHWPSSTPRWPPPESDAELRAQRGYALDNGVQVEVFVDNLFDEKYIKDAGNTGDALGLATFIAGEPRFYGLRVSFRFGSGK